MPPKNKTSPVKTKTYCKITSQLYGLFIHGSNENYISNNIIELNEIIGIGLQGDFGEILYNNTIESNTIKQNLVGISLFYSNANIIKNNFIRNNKNVEIKSANHIWNENYWDDWIGLSYPLLLGWWYPKIIFGQSTGFGFIVEFDWHPENKPYNY